MKLTLMVEHERFCEGLDFWSQDGKHYEMRRMEGVKIFQQRNDLTMEILGPALDLMKLDGRVQFINQFR